MTIIKFLEDEKYYYDKDYPQIYEIAECSNLADCSDAMKARIDKKFPSLPYDPAFIMTDDRWLVKRLRHYAREHPEVDLASDSGNTIRMSIPKADLAICIP